MSNAPTPIPESEAPAYVPAASNMGKLSDPHELAQTGRAFTQVKSGSATSEWNKHLAHAARNPQAGLL